MESPLTAIALALLITFIGAEIARKLKYPRVIGQLMASFILAIPVIQHFFISSSGDTIQVLSELGVIFLLLLTGFELNLEDLKKNKREASFIAFFAAITPFTFGLVTAHFLGWGWKVALVLGACLSVTAEGTKVAILIETDKLNTKIGNIMLGAGILDDIFEILFLSIILILSHPNTGQISLTTPLAKIIAFAIGIVIVLKWLPKFIQKITRCSNIINLLNGMIVIGLLMSILSELVGLGSIFGAFLAGILLQKSSFSPGNREQEAQSLRLLSFAFIIPFFFVNIGLNFDYRGLIDTPLLTIGIVLIAILGKILGTLAVKPFVNLSWKQLYLIGWGMNSRGVMELVMAQIALANGLIGKDLYSAIVFMAIITTTIFPFVFKRALRTDPKIMD